MYFCKMALVTAPSFLLPGTSWPSLNTIKQGKPYTCNNTHRHRRMRRVSRRSQTAWLLRPIHQLWQAPQSWSASQLLTSGCTLPSAKTLRRTPVTVGYPTCSTAGRQNADLCKVITVHGTPYTFQSSPCLRHAPPSPPSAPRTPAQQTVQPPE